MPRAYLRVPPSDHPVTLPGWRAPGDTRDVLLTVERPEPFDPITILDGTRVALPQDPPEAPPFTVMAPPSDLLPQERSAPRPWSLADKPVLLRIAPDVYDAWLTPAAATLSTPYRPEDLYAEDRHTSVTWRLECTGWDADHGPTFRGSPVLPYSFCLPLPWGQERHLETDAYLTAYRKGPIR